MESIIQHIQKSNSIEVTEQVFDRGAETMHVFVSSKDPQDESGFEPLLNHITSILLSVKVETCESVLIKDGEHKVCVHYFRNKGELTKAHESFLEQNHYKNCPTII